MSPTLRPLSTPDESIELAPITLLAPEVTAQPPRRSATSRMPQAPLPPIPRPMDEPPRLSLARG